MNSNQSSASGPSILVVDDEPMIRALIADFLRQKNAIVREASDGIEALKLSRSTLGAPDLLITDLMMSGMGGVALLAELRKEHPQMPALLISGFYGDSHGLADSLDERTRFLAKPFDFAKLQAHTSALLPGFLQEPAPATQSDRRPGSPGPGGRAGAPSAVPSATSPERWQK